MARMSHGLGKLLAAGVLLAGLIAAALGYQAWSARHKPVTVGGTPATIPVPASKPGSTALATSPAEPVIPRSVLDIVRAAYPDFPTTQPLAVPLDISQAAHLVLHEPVYLSGIPRQELWITRPDAAPTERVLKDAVDDKQDVDAHVLRERVVFVHWMPDNVGIWPPYMVCAKPDGSYEVVSTAFGRRLLPARRDYHWEHALAWNEKVVVPSASGVSVFRFAPDVSESYHELASPAPAAGIGPGRKLAEPRVLLDAEGLTAWIPWENGLIGSRGAGHYVDAKEGGKWTDLSPDSGWPEKILHLVPLLDGTVLVMSVNDAGAVQVGFNTLAHAAVNEEQIAKLVDALSEADDKKRKEAYDQLSQYGSGIWPILEKLMNDQPPEAQARLRQLLKQKAVPTLNGMALTGDKSLKLAARLADGGTVFYAEHGVSIPNLQDPDAGPDFRAPAWISIRPGRAIELLPPALTEDLIAGKSRLYAMGNDWIVTNDVRGPRRFVGNGFVTLLRKSEHAFSEFVGTDRRGRWVFKKPAAGASTVTTGPATLPSTSPEPATAPSDAGEATLIVDPTLPDPTPRLPVWVFKTAETVGWDKAGWPVTKRASAYALHEEGWQLVDEKEEVFTRADQVPPITEPSATSTTATAPATTHASEPGPTTDAVPATTPATAPVDPSLLLIDHEGNHYFGGLTDLRVVTRSGKEATWTLPPTANGPGPATLIRTEEGRLFLFNQPGRVVRIKPTPGAAQPFKVEKVFTHNIPTVDHPTRIWLDPGGRIIMAWDNQLAIFFPAGYIPPAIAEKMLTEWEPEEGE
ncbi:MAG: hypothetical protein JWP03_2787 [Phycisphaerales bacterium]|nr:hypothetical protein [Phycisphaerales bacterium]